MIRSKSALLAPFAPLLPVVSRFQPSADLLRIIELSRFLNRHGTRIFSYIERVGVNIVSQPVNTTLLRQGERVYRYKLRAKDRFAVATPDDFVLPIKSSGDAIIAIATKAKNPPFVIDARFIREMMQQQGGYIGVSLK